MADGHYGVEPGRSRGAPIGVAPTLHGSGLVPERGGGRGLEGLGHAQSFSRSRRNCAQVISTIALGYAEIAWRKSLDAATPGLSNAHVSLDDISEQDEVTGTVVRVSNYGVFIDIGAGVDAFLHRRKMKVRITPHLC